MLTHYPITDLGVTWPERPKGAKDKVERPKNVNMDQHHQNPTNHTQPVEIELDIFRKNQQ